MASRSLTFTITTDDALTLAVARRVARRLRRTRTQALLAKRRIRRL